MEDDKHVNFSSEDNEEEVKDNPKDFIDKAEESADVLDSSEEDEAPENNNYQIDGKFTVDDEEIEFFDDDDKKRERPLGGYGNFDRNERPSKKKKLTRLVKKTKDVEDEIVDPEPPEEPENNIDAEGDSDDFIVGKDSYRNEPEINTNAYRLDEYLGGDSYDDMQYNEDEPEEAEVVKSDIELLREHFEPDVLKENFLTKEDQFIKESDIPERYLLREQELTRQMGEKRPQVTESEILEEARWIASKIAPSFQENEELNEKIARVLRLMLIKNLDIPFIHVYHKDDLYPEITDYKTLWAIFDHDEKWILLQHKKKNYRKVMSLLSEAEFQNVNEIERLMDALEKSSADEEVEDIFNNFQFYFGEEIAELKQKELQEKQKEKELKEIDKLIDDDIAFFQSNDSSVTKTFAKRPLKKSFFHQCKKEGYVEVVKRFGLSASQFGDNLLKCYPFYEPKDDPYEPLQVLEQQFPNLLNFESALLRCRKLLSLSIFHDPKVRSHFRSLYQEFSLISTLPTNKGKKEIDAFHIYYNVKRLNKKPIMYFKNSVQWLEILNAEKEELIKVEINLPREQRLEKFEEFYLNKDFSSLSQLWNEQRRSIFQEALVLIEKHFVNEIRLKLKLQANTYLMELCKQEVEKRITLMPFQVYKRNLNLPPHHNDPNHPEDNNNNNNNNNNNDQDFYKQENQFGDTVVDKRFQILSVCIDNEDDNKPIACALLDVNGELKEFFELQFFLTRVEANSLNAKRKSQERNRFTEFIVQHKPAVIGIGACLGGKKAKEVFRAMEELKLEINKSYKSEKLENIEILWIQGEASRIISHSKLDKAGVTGHSKEEQYTGLQRMALSLGRYVQHPLSEYCNLWNSSNDILCLQLHPLQSNLNPPLLKKQLERSFIEIVGQVGVDVNQLLRFPHHRNKLKFVSGFGDRKMAQLFIALNSSGGKILRRADMSHYLSKNLYTNSIAFMKIDALYVPKKDLHSLDLLDRTRIHPLHYPLARKLAYYFVNGNVDLSDEDNTSNSNHIFASLFSKFLKDPSKYFHKHHFSSFLHSERQHNILYEDIKNEFVSPFQLARNVFKRFLNPIDADLFTWLTGENDITLHRGQSVDAKIYAIAKNKQVMCWLPNGMQGVIPFDYISDNEVKTQVDVEKLIKIGMNVKARVLDVKKAELRVNLTTRAKDLKKDIWEREYIKEHKFDPNLDHDTPSNNAIELAPPSSSSSSSSRGSSALLKSVAGESGVQKKSFQNRLVDHPLFKNVDYKKTMEELEGKPLGSVVIRPSSKGNDHLTISWKFTDKIVLHVDVKEEKKSDLTPLSIGKQLIIASNSYEDLDEILAHYLDPIILFCQEVFAHRKYNASPSHLVEEVLLKEKEKAHNSIPYCVAVNEKHPGYFDICYVPNKRVHFESFSVHPEGFKFRKKVFHNLSKLLDYFKHHYKDNLQSKHSSSTPSSNNNNSKRPHPSSSSSSSRPRGYREEWN